MSSGGSPNDPVFWLHHANIDRLWADWQLEENHWSLDHRGYLPVNTGPNGINVNDPMLPWSNAGVTPATVANFYSIDAIGYKYDKYFRSDIHDKEDASKRLDHKLSSPDTLREVNFNLIKGSFDVLADTLKRPVFPIK